MSDRQDGGPAFPSSGDYCDPRGMTLRDYFAGRALVVWLSIFSTDEFNEVAEYAYRMADAMLAERSKR